MGTRTRREPPARLAAVRRRFQAWRETHKPRSRIPDPLWRSAVRVVGVYGLNRTARALQLDYYALKKRIEQEAPVNGSTATAPAAVSKAEVVTPFLELVPPLSVGASECVLELENAAGAKMRVHLKGVASPDLAALSRSFWNPGP
jgi:hypothetical protein